MRKNLSQKAKASDMTLAALFKPKLFCSHHNQ
jgi:hypothetical protein